MRRRRSSSASFGGRAGRPFQTADGVGRRLVGHGGLDAGDDFRFSSRCRRRPAPGRLDIRLVELPAAGGDRGRVDAERFGDAPVAAAATLERFGCGEQTPLPVVEQAGEQDGGGAQQLRQVGVAQGRQESGSAQPQASGAELARPVCVVGRAVEELAGELVPGQPAGAEEFAPGVLGGEAWPGQRGPERSPGPAGAGRGRRWRLPARPPRWAAHGTPSVPRRSRPSVQSGRFRIAAQPAVLGGGGASAGRRLRRRARPAGPCVAAARSTGAAL